MSDKICLNCKWLAQSVIDHKHLKDNEYPCLNPLNDILFKHFNTSTGDYVTEIRRAMITKTESTCHHFENGGKNGQV
jgi:hypothetical protein